MKVSELEGAPTSERHPAYAGSMLYTTAPEWSTGEVLLAAAYRGLLLDVRESAVDLENISRVSDAMPAAVGGRETWSRLLTERGGIASPLRHGQYSPMASRQVMPLVPSVARIAGVLGKRPRSRWNPYNLLLETIGAGLGSSEGLGLVRSLGASLEVTDNDDLFARFVELALQQGLQAVPVIPQPAGQAPFRTLTLDEKQYRAYRSRTTSRLSPAERFCKDLPAVLGVKDVLTRRQWTVLVEAIFRLGLGMHVLWTCNANILLWEMVLSVASGEPAPSSAAVEAALWEMPDETRALLELGTNAEPLMRRLIEQYAYARTGLNLLLCRLDDGGTAWPDATPIGFSPNAIPNAPAALAAFLQHVQANRRAIDTGDAGHWLRARVSEWFDKNEELRALALCDSGYTKNLFEFARHSLGQVWAKQADQRSYDLAYLIAFSGERKPQLVQPGPAMLVVLVHACCAANPSIPVSLDDFRRHLSEYGLHVPAGELVDGKAGRDLAMLGLVVDSPDAAGGRLLVRPF